eukprot:355342-Chlamydomonas_euryale.AAC.4
MSVCGRVGGSTSERERSTSVGAAGRRQLRLRPVTGHCSEQPDGCLLLTLVRVDRTAATSEVWGVKGLRTIESRYWRAVSAASASASRRAARFAASASSRFSRSTSSFATASCTPGWWLTCARTDEDDVSTWRVLWMPLARNLPCSVESHWDLGVKAAGGRGGLVPASWPGRMDSHSVDSQSMDSHCETTPQKRLNRPLP